MPASVYVGLSVTSIYGKAVLDFPYMIPFTYLLTYLDLIPTGCPRSAPDQPQISLKP